LRGDLVHIFAASSVGVWIAAVRPDVSPPWRAAFAGLWALLVLVVIGAALAEWRQHRVWRRLTAQVGGAPPAAVSTAGTDPLFHGVFPCLTSSSWG
jgi:hypothetical protein